MCEDAINVKHGLKMSAFTIYNSLLEFDELLSTVSVDHHELTDAQMSKMLFSKLDVFAEILSHQSFSEPSRLHSLIRRISISPTKKFQLWVIEDKLIIFAESSCWLAFKSALFLEGELLVNKKVVWDEDKLLVSMTLFYIVHDEYEDLKVSFSNSAIDESIHQPECVYMDSAEGKELEINTSALDMMKAYSEVWAIISLLEKTAAERIPLKVKRFFEENRLKEYEPKIDVTKPLNEQNLMRKTLAILALINVNYWCNSEEERESYLREMAKNDNQPFEKEDMSWDLEQIFGIDEPSDYPVDVVDSIRLSEEDGHVTVHMPRGNIILFVDDVYSAPMRQFGGDVSDEGSITALEIRLLCNGFRATVEVKNINLDNIYIPCSLPPGSSFAVFDGMYICQRDREVIKISASYNEDGILCVKNDSDCNIRILKSLRKSESILLEYEDFLVDQEGESILSFSNLSGWSFGVWDPNNDDEWW